MNLLRIPSKIAVLIISLYQATLSPDHGRLFKGKYPHGYCRFYPSCSQYTKEAIENKGLFKGVWQGFKRILRCNPWSEPRIDNV